MGSKQNAPQLRGLRSTPEQKAHIINYMYCHRSFAHGQFRGPLGSRSIKTKWEQLAAEVNNVHGGIKKPVATWKKTWADIKKRTKAKAMALISERNRTGHFPQGDDVFDTLERKVLVIIGRVAIQGIPGAKDSMPESQGALIRLMSGNRRVIDEENPVSLFETYNIDVNLIDEPVHITARHPEHARKKEYLARMGPSWAAPESTKMHLQVSISQNESVSEKQHEIDAVAQGSCATQTERMEVQCVMVEQQESKRSELKRIAADFEEVVDWTDIDE